MQTISVVESLQGIETWLNFYTKLKWQLMYFIGPFRTKRLYIVLFGIIIVTNFMAG